MAYITVMLETVYNLIHNTIPNTGFNNTQTNILQPNNIDNWQISTFSYIGLLVAMTIVVLINIHILRIVILHLLL